MTAKSAAAFRTISEVADEIGVPQHVLRFWETKFTAVKPMKRGGNRRYYRPEDVELLRTINRLLYADGYTIKGVQKLLRDKAVTAKTVGMAGHDPAPVAAESAVPALPDAAFLTALRAIRDRVAAAVDEARSA